MNRVPLSALLVLLGAGAMAQDQPVVTVEITPEEVLVGESAQLRVTVLVPTWFPSPPAFPSFELANAITRLPPNSSFPTSRRVGRDTWSGIVRNYRVYPLLAANYRLGGQTIAVTYANPGAEPARVDVEIPEVAFRGVVPAGAESIDPYIAGRQLTLRREVGGDVTDLEAGSALVVRYVAELDGLPAMFVPPLFPGIVAPGVAVYPDEPVVEDGNPARRTESVTLVFEAGGDFTLPALSLDWWNTESQQVETVSIEPMAFTVAGPLPVQATSEESVLPSWWPISALIVALGVFVVGWRYAWPRIISRRAAARIAREQSEQYAFRELDRALRTGDAHQVYQRMMTWVERIEPGCGPRRFARRHGGPDLGAIVSGLVAALYGEPGEVPDLARLRKGLSEARHAAARREDMNTPGLPPLNP